MQVFRVKFGSLLGMVGRLLVAILLEVGLKKCVMYCCVVGLFGKTSFEILDCGLMLFVEHVAYTAVKLPDISWILGGRNWLV